jgi:RimJ/RimL family protein N-acetyltransferase
MGDLQTETLILMPCAPQDAADFIALERDAEVMRYLNGGVPVDRRICDPEADFLMPDGSESHVWTARRKAGGGFVGWFCLWPDVPEVAELGFRLCHKDWGQGLGTQGGRALLDWGFQCGAYRAVFASTAARNLGSRRVMEKIGMRMKRDEDGKGEVIYVIERVDWARDSKRP